MSNTVSLGSLYEMNKQIMKTQPIATSKEIKEWKDKLRDWFKDKEYAMLLCNEQHDYTVFHRTKGCCKMQNNTLTDERLEKAASEVIECMKERGNLLSVDFLDDGAVEIWMRTSKGDPHVYLLFDYEYGIVKY